MEERNQIREQMQESAALTLSRYKRLICRWATGVGKSGVALRFLSGNPGLSTLIVVPEINNIDNWWAEFDKFGVSRDNVTIICYASLKNYADTEWGLLILDECPHVDTDLRAEVLGKIKAEHVLALGAVVSEEEQDVLESTYGHFHQSRVTLDMAISAGILPQPTVCVMHMQLDNIHRMYKYDGRLCTAKEVYDTINAKVNGAVLAYNSSSTVWNQRKMLKLGNERKRFLGEQKTRAMGIICENLKQRNRRFLCFCSSIKQAEQLGGEHAFTSKTPKSMDVLNRFNRHELDSLYVVGKLIEGQNLNDIDCGVIGQLGGQERITTQSIGRIMRSMNPVIYVPVYDGTKDDSFMYSLRSSISDRYIKHYKL